MSNRLSFPTATGWIIEALGTLLTPLTVSSGIPSNEAAFVRVRRTGGFQEGVIDHAQFAIEYYAKWEDDSERGATDLRDRIQSWEGSVINGVSVKEVTNAGLALLPDPQLPLSARTTFICTLDLRGTMAE